MIEIGEVSIDKERFEVRMASASSATNFLLINHVNDVADEIQRRAQELAPQGETGELKNFGILVNHAHEASEGDFGDPGSFVDVRSPAFGGGFSVRGGNPRNTGQFSRRPFEGAQNEPGRRFLGGVTRDRKYQAEVYLNPRVEHAKWVHEGTGIFGQYKSPIVPRTKPKMIFKYYGRWNHRTSVKGQKAQPFLTNAYEYVRTTYEPVKLAELRALLSGAI